MSGKQNPLKITIVYNKSNTFGLEKDANLLAAAIGKVWKDCGRTIEKVRLMDAREYPIASDICIHLEVPVAAWFGWAKTHVMVVNPEWWVKDWDCYACEFNTWVFKTDSARDRFVSGGLCNGDNSVVLRWTCGDEISGEKGSVDTSKGFVWFCGGSKNKIAAAEAIVPLWKSSWGPLVVYSTQKMKVEDGDNVRVIVGDLDAKKRAAIAQEYPGHICISTSEGFGYSAAEARAYGAFTVLNTIDTYTELYGGDGSDGIGWVRTGDLSYARTPYARFVDWTTMDREELCRELEKVITQYRATDLAALRKSGKDRYAAMNTAFYKGVQELFVSIAANADKTAPLPKHMPPVLLESDCPPISVVTLTHNRPKFIQNACMNLLMSDYPRDKIEWIVVDDSEATMSPINDVVNFQRTFAPGKVVYVPVNAGTSIGKKRNKGVSSASNDIILMMDDDDHVPITSFRRRVAWLTKYSRKGGVKRAAVCTAIALYDLQKGVSAMNVPPYDLGLSARCSEATLTFTRDFWKERKFADVNMAEGEGFLAGREGEVVEMPPQQIIVALQHGGNLSSRLIPGDASPGCFWGFQKELLVFLHGLVGVSIEDGSKSGQRK